MKHIPHILAEQHVYVRLDHDGQAHLQRYYEKWIEGVEEHVQRREGAELMLRKHHIDHDVWRFTHPDLSKIFGAEGKFLFVDGIIYTTNPLEPERTIFIDEYEAMVVQIVSECLNSMPQPLIYDWPTLMGRMQITSYGEGERYALHALPPFFVGGRPTATCIFDKFDVDEKVVLARCTINVLDIEQEPMCREFDCIVEDDRLTVTQREGCESSTTKE